MEIVIDSDYSAGASSWEIKSGTSCNITFDESLFVTYSPAFRSYVEMGTRVKA